ncbi:MAG TPA: hypothetical protein DCR58_01735 [Idiomarina baltica]|jgi:hypothetical protein|uniref:Uncharacterized protein n=2 Tax=Idiomarina baltica TaxID=190892 RepID=A0A348WLS5_9GAMM|nr:hypothetical protein OS145_12734 [Idiomarina baltica OS145]KXS36043.1 MAG: Uncharacterized protein AWU56_640 [Idiomarina sp. T82-3]MAF75148.1 hypothetical protein [Idiomarinaceae bacterium]MBR37820.1 hypothetical protein [Idiomarina sp.]HAR55487.1 hypothetical protein [Idiomarina baltica]
MVKASAGQALTESLILLLMCAVFLFGTDWGQSVVEQLRQLGNLLTLHFKTMLNLISFVPGSGM